MEPSSFRPISLVDTVAKLYERLILQRLEAELVECGGLSTRQFGFRRGMGTINAISRVLELAGDDCGRERQPCVLISLDVRNAFKTASWRAVDDAVRRKGLSRKLGEVLRAYMSEREIQIPTGTGQKSRMSMSAGVPQGSVLGPTLWNILYDGALRLDLPVGVHMVAYADDLAIITRSRTIPELEAATGAAIEAVSTWMRQRGLSLAPHKTEAVMWRKRGYHDLPTITVDGHAMTPSRGIRYLGVKLDSNRSFMSHVEEAASRAESAAKAVARLMPNCQTRVVRP